MPSTCPAAKTSRPVLIACSLAAPPPRSMGIWPTPVKKTLLISPFSPRPVKYSDLARKITFRGTGTGPKMVAGAEPCEAAGGPVGVLLCHGFTGSPQALRPWAEYLADQGLTVSLPRLPGHGTTWQDLARTGWRDWFAEVDVAFGKLAG